MPRKHSKNKKLDALELLSYGLPVNLVQANTGISLRTLYRWKRQLRQKQQRQMAGKKSSFMTKLPQNSDSCHKDQESCHKTADHCHNDMAVAAHVTQDDQADPADSESANSDDEDLALIRSKLMNVVRDIAIGLDHAGPDINSRSLAISRLLDRIQWIDQLMELQDPKPVAEAETHDYPGWLRVRDRSDEERAAEQAEIDRRRAWAESPIELDEFLALADPT